MSAIVTIFKTEFVNKQEVQKRIEGLSADKKEVGNALIYIPQSGKLIEFLSILREHKVAYGTHFDTNP